MCSFQDLLSRPSYRNGQREHKMSSFQDPILRDSVKYPTNSNGQELAERTQLKEQSTEAPQEDIATDCDSFQDPAYKWNKSQQ